MFSTITGHYNTLVEAIIRPPRDDYSLHDLGPKRFRAGSRVWFRKDLHLVNNRGLKLECSHYIPDKLTPNQRWPCVVYLHGNSSSRVEAMGVLEVVLPLPCTLFCFDFAGSGISEGEYVSLGYYEKDDLAVVIDYLRNTGFIGSIGLWGRSMGAVTALLHADRDPSLACLVLDSPFTNLRKLAGELVQSGHYVKFAGFLTSMVVDGMLHLIKGSVSERAQFDIDDLVPIEHVSHTFVPAYFIAGAEDNFIMPHHSEQLWQAYAGVDKLYDVIAQADHNSSRPRSYLRKIADFLRAALQCESGGLLGEAAALSQGAGEDDKDKEGELPPGFRTVDSRSRPGTTVYEDMQTRRRYGSRNQAWNAHRRKDELIGQGGHDESIAGGSSGSAARNGNGVPETAGATGIAHDADAKGPSGKDAPDKKNGRKSSNRNGKDSEGAARSEGADEQPAKARDRRSLEKMKKGSVESFQATSDFSSSDEDRIGNIEQFMVPDIDAVVPGAQTNFALEDLLHLGFEPDLCEKAMDVCNTMEEAVDYLVRETTKDIGA